MLQAACIVVRNRHAMPLVFASCSSYLTGPPSTVATFRDSVPLNAVTFLTGEDKRVINTIFLKDQLKSNPKHTRTAQLSLMVLTLIVVKIYEKCENSQHCAAAAATQLPPFIINLSD